MAKKAGFKTHLKNKDKKAIQQRIQQITTKLLNGKILSNSDRTYWKAYCKEVN